MPPPEEPTGVLFDGDDLAFGGVRIKSTAAANREVLDGAFESARPAHTQGRSEALIVGVGAGEVAVVGVPIVLGAGEFAGEWAS